MKRATNRTLLCAASALLIGMATSAQAQIEEIEVTATKTGATQLQKTPIAISAFSANDLDRSLTGNVKDLLQMTPNMTVPQNNSYAQIYIRGIGSNNVFSGSDPSSTVHIDGVYIGRPFGQFANFLDVERVEVLRGPQGTLYGRNSVGGTINVISRLPTDEIQGKAQLTLGNYSAVTTEAYLSGPIVPGKVQASVSGSYTEHDYYRKNVSTGGDLQDDKSGSGRFQLRLQPTDKIDAITRFDFFSQYNRPMGFAKILLPYDPLTNSILGDYSKIAANGISRGTTRMYGVSEEINFDLGFAKLKSLTAYRSSKTDTHNDTDSTDRDITYSNIEEAARQLSEEVNLTGKWGRLDYVVGLYFLNERITSDNVIEQRSAGTQSRFLPHTSTNVAAGFAQGNYHLTDQLSATVGVRYAREEKEFKQDFGSYIASTGLISAAGPIRYTGNSVYYSTTPKFGLEYVPMDNVLVFGSVTRGFKSGGYNMTATLASVAAFAPEDLWSYEVGVKTDWLNKRLRVNLTGFYYDYSNMQVQAFIRPGVADITNAASATVKGLELELTAQPVQGLQLTANLAWLDGTYDSYARAPGPGGTIVDASGNRINAAPKYSTNFAAEYDWIQPSGDMFFVRGEYFWQDRQFFVASNDPNQSQGAYGLLNASIGYEAPDARWRVALYGKNLTDRQYITITGTVSPVISGRPGDPRTFGVRGTYKF